MKTLTGGVEHKTYKNAPASCNPKFRDAGCRMENLQIINFKLLQPALRDLGFEMRNIIIYNLVKNVITLKPYYDK